MKNQVTKVKVRWFVAVALGLLIVMLFATGPLFYFAKPIRGRIIESGSKMPIQGAIVVADWRMYSMGIGGLLRIREYGDAAIQFIVVPAEAGTQRL